jgi:hypothetical protein
MKFTPETPRESYQFQGFKVAVPIFFPPMVDQDDLIASLSLHSIPIPVVSSLLQSLVVENTRNNVAKKIKEEVIEPALKSIILRDPAVFAEATDDQPALCRIAEDGSVILIWDGKIESLPNDVKKELADSFTIKAQEKADEYFSSYIPAIPRKKGAAGPSLDPVEDMARELFRQTIYASWKETTFKDLSGKIWTGIRSQDRANSAHQAANAMLEAGQRPPFMDQAVFDKFDGEITSVKDYVDAYTELLFASTSPAGMAKVERLRETAREQLERTAAVTRPGEQADDLLA